jgi:hypothetical protein
MTDKPKARMAIRDAPRFVWQPDEIVIRRAPAPVAAAAETVDLHGTRGDPGYGSMHPGNAGKGKERLDSGGMVGSPDYTAKEHQDALSDYTIDTLDVGTYLRTGETNPGADTEKLKRQIDVLSDLIDVQDRTGEDQTLYRGAKSMPDLVVGDVFHDRSFTSTSTAERQAQKHVKSYKGQGQLITVHLPAGSKGLKVAEVEPWGDSEKEFILPAGTRFRVTGRSPDGGLQVEVIE